MIILGIIPIGVAVWLTYIQLFNPIICFLIGIILQGFIIKGLQGENYENKLE